MNAAAGLTERHRHVYDLLVNKHPNGLTRPDLALRAGGDRAARQTVEDLRTIAATNPHPRHGVLVLGYDPLLEVYTFAKDHGQALRIIRYQAKRATALVAPILAQLDAAEETFGPLADAGGAQQPDMFGMRRVMEALT